MADRRYETKKSYKTKKWLLSYDTFHNLKNNFYIGIARGVGTAIGFTVLGAAVLLVMQFIPFDKIPFIGPLIQELNNIVRNRMG